MLNRVALYTSWIGENLWALITSAFVAVFAYFYEIQGVVYVMWAAFIIDLIIGIRTSLHVRNENLDMDKLFTAFSRLTIASILIMLLYSMDREMGQDFVCMYKLTAWFITGFIIYSIAENGFELTGYKLFEKVKRLINKKAMENAGVSFDDSDEFKDKSEEEL